MDEQTTIESRVRVVVLRDDPAGRFKAGDEGTLLENDSEKYAYEVQLDGEDGEEFELLPGLFINNDRIFYFHKGELSFYADHEGERYVAADLEDEFLPEEN